MLRAAPAADGSHLVAIVNKMISIALFAVMAAMIKALGEDYPVGQIVFCRSAFALIPVLWLVHRAGGASVLGTAHPWGHLRRRAAGSRGW
jgi:hypothetical protein